MIIASIDGGARGNPGPAGYGVRIEDEDGRLLAELRGALGLTTNNVAEYEALIAALTYALEHQHPALHVRSDSELLVRQMRGDYRVRHPRLQPLHAKARLLAAGLASVTFEHVPRRLNAEADRLANLAMDEAQAASAAPTVNSPEPHAG
jgi:ribonuclease HI